VAVPGPSYGTAMTRGGGAESLDATEGVVMLHASGGLPFALNLPYSEQPDLCGLQSYIASLTAIVAAGGK
jgi:hypothetical protein